LVRSSCDTLYIHCCNLQNCDMGGDLKLTQVCCVILQHFWFPTGWIILSLCEAILSFGMFLLSCFQVHSGADFVRSGTGWTSFANTWAPGKTERRSGHWASAPVFADHYKAADQESRRVCRQEEFTSCASGTQTQWTQWAEVKAGWYCPLHHMWGNNGVHCVRCFFTDISKSIKNVTSFFITWYFTVYGNPLISRNKGIHCLMTGYNHFYTWGYPKIQGIWLLKKVSYPKS